MIALSLKVDTFFSSSSKFSIVYRGPTPFTTERSGTNRNKLIETIDMLLDTRSSEILNHEL